MGHQPSPAAARHQDQLERGLEPEESAARAVATAESAGITLAYAGVARHRSFH